MAAADVLQDGNIVPFEHVRDITQAIGPDDDGIYGNRHGFLATN
ncbi:MAG: hypothetical protein AB7E59_08670 [Pusillimonas sp.]